MNLIALLSPYMVRAKFGLTLFFLQLGFCWLFAMFVDHSGYLLITRNEKFDPDYIAPYGTQRVMVDTQLTMLLATSFIMTFLKRYGFKTVWLSVLVTAIAMQWATICQGFFKMKYGKMHLDIINLLYANYAAATVLISLGSVSGLASPIQMIVMTLLEIPIFAANEYLSNKIFMATDIGASMFCHVFGAYFGLMVSFVLGRRQCVDSATTSSKERNKENKNNSKIPATIGTVFLWLFFPIFNGGLAKDDGQERAIVNTYYSLLSSWLASYIIYSFINKDCKFGMVDVQNATLAGGVAIGTAADMMIYPWLAIIIGAISGIMSVLGCRYLSPLFEKKLGILDSYRIHSFHGLPGVLAGVIGAIATATATDKDYGFESLYNIFPAMMPDAMSNSKAERLEYAARHNNIRKIGMDPKKGLGRSAQQQASYQVATLFTTWTIAIVGGLITGFVLRWPIFSYCGNPLLDDLKSWENPDEEKNEMLTGQLDEDAANYKLISIENQPEHEI